MEHSHVLDFGSGAGVPGVPLAIVMPTATFTLLEGRERRASFLSEVIRRLGLRNCSVVQGRAELATDLHEQCDVVVARCAGDPTHLVPAALRFTKPGASVIVSGPPRPSASAVGVWIEVESAFGAAQHRHFLVVKRGAKQS